MYLFYIYSDKRRNFSYALTTRKLIGGYRVCLKEAGIGMSVVRVHTANVHRLVVNFNGLD